MFDLAQEADGFGRGEVVHGVAGSNGQRRIREMIDRNGKRWEPHVQKETAAVSSLMQLG